MCSSLIFRGAQRMRSIMRWIVPRFVIIYLHLCILRLSFRRQILRQLKQVELKLELQVEPQVLYIIFVQFFFK